MSPLPLRAIAVSTDRPNGSGSPSDRVIERLIQSGKINTESLAHARWVAAEADEPAEAVLCKLGLVSERDMAECFHEALELSWVRSEDFPPNPERIEALSPKFLRRFQILPLTMVEGRLDLAMAYPLDEYAVTAIELHTGQQVARLVATPTDISAALDRVYGPEDEGPDQSDDVGPGTDDLERLKDLASDAPVVRLVNQLITRAVEARSSDIHIEPGADRLAVRYRIDGLMREMESPSFRLRDAVISRLKIMARLNIAERRLPQDGRMSFAVRGTEIDFRVSTVPTIHGESVVIRILDQGQVSLDFSALGFDDEILTSYLEILKSPHGIVLVTGPTGSGKTTTLYASLAVLNTAERKVMTIEDPVEYQLDRVNQVQVQSQIGLTFARALRAFLRQNPNVVMVGEIRDLETAQIAVQAALTGHMILSTLHTNDAATGITRLLDMGVEDYLLTSTITAIVGQRLVRKLCPGCRKPFRALPEYAERLGIVAEPPPIFYEACGCDACGGSGYRGRTTILEILPVTDRIRELILAHASAGEIERAAIDAGMRTMQRHGIAKALAGITTIEEVLAVTREG